MKSSKRYRPLVECPFCHKQVISKKLADHAKQFHANAAKGPAKATNAAISTMDGIEISDPSLVQEIKHHFIDESGVLVNPDLLGADEHQRSQGERLGPVSVPKQQKKRARVKTREVRSDCSLSEKRAGAKENENVSTAYKHHKTIDEIYREKIEWLKKLPKANKRGRNGKQIGFMICPVCKVVVKAKRIEKHFAKVHRSLRVSNMSTKEGSTENIIDPASFQNQHISKPVSDAKQKRTNTSAISHQSLAEKRRKLVVKDTKEAEEADHIPHGIDLVKCPLCRHKTSYNVLFVHLQVSHPEVNPKIVMAKFNRAHRTTKPVEKATYQDELDALVKDYERLKQGLDEPRDGGKYVGYMRREQGKFGSLPLYDDYSDEADAE